MARDVSLLLLDNVEGLGIVGDVVNVRAGFARNFLLPRELATEPTQELIEQLAERRAVAQRELEQLRADRATMIEKLEGHELTLERACNDQGLLYGSVTQHDIAEALAEQGYDMPPRAVRLPHTIKRIDSYEVLIKLDQDLETTIKLWVVADRELNIDDDRDEMEFDDEGNLIESTAAAAAEPAAAAEGDADQGEAKSEA